MNLGRVCAILSRFALFFTLLQGVMLAVAALEGDSTGAGSVDGVVRPVHSTTGFAVGVGVGLLVAAVLALGGRGSSNDFFRKEGIAVVGTSWLLAGGLGAIPFVWSGALVGLADGFFESVSGLTTTGASVCGGGGNAAIEELPPSLLLWRSLLQWLGGLGIILVFLVVLPYFGVTGKNLLDSEAVGMSTERARPRMQEQARKLLGLYAALTAAEFVLLWALTLMGPFDALCHALTTMATGGFSTRNASISAYDSVAVEGIVLVFMFLAGANFPLLLRAVRQTRSQLLSHAGDGALDSSRRGDRLLDSPEMRLYLGITLVATAVVAGTIWYGGTDPLTAVRQSAFQVVSILTSTGYCTADFQAWPTLAVAALWLCMFIGGSTGSTAGGLKILRVLLCAKLVVHEVRRFIQPNRVARIRLGDDVVAPDTVSMALGLLLLWLVCVAAGATLLGLDERLDLVSCLSASQSMMSCTGPAITAVIPAGDGTGAYVLANTGGIDLGPFGGFGELHGWAKVGLAFQMVLGRLEILAPLVLFSPAIWKK